MEFGLNTVFAPSTQSKIAVEVFPTLDRQSDNSAFNKTCDNNAGNGANVVDHSILNLFASPKECCIKKEDLPTKDQYELASLILKNALNVRRNNVDIIESQTLTQKQKNNSKILQCNSSDHALQQQQKEVFAKTSDDLLAALRVKNTNTTSKLIKNKQIATPNVPTSSSTSASASSTSTSATYSSILAAPATNSSSSTFTVAASRTPVMSTKPAASTVNGIKNGLQIPSDILDDLASRFIINVPDMELSNFIRICFQIELAHWFYLDFFCAADQQQQRDEAGKKRKLPSCGMKQFAIQLFQHIPFLREHLSSIDKILDDWKNYKLSVPTYGAILISEDLNFCLLVQSYFAKSSWGFPKGKVNENEDPVHCATREVYEETGYDITKLIVPNDYIEAVFNYQYTRLYIVRDVSLDTQFSPRTRNEIKCCDWFPIDSLPVNKNDAISKAKLGINANSFFMIMPFVKPLKKWVHDKRSGLETQRKYSGAVGSNSSDFTNSPATLMTTAAAATAAAVCGGTYNCNNQKHTNANSSSKKIKPHTNYDDKHNALKMSGGNTANCGNSNNATAASTSNSSNRSKRQRHKSMGDLDGIKLNNLSSNNCNLNTICKNSSNMITTASDNIEPITESISNNGESGNCKTGSNHKRNGSSVKLVTAGSSNNGQNSNNNNVAGCTSSKRQLFHSQSQNGSNQNGEKIVSSFDLIRKEKQQQLKASAEKASKVQRQQQQSQSNAGYNSGRVRAKSQSDKMCVQQQSTNKNSNSNTNNNNNCGGNNKHRVQKQLSMIIVNSNAITHSDNKSNHNNNNAINNTAAHSARVASNPTPTASTGAELLAFAVEAASTPSLTSTTNSAQKPRPASATLHFATPTAGQPTQELQRMASGTNLRILKRSTSYNTQQPQPQQQELQPKKNLIQILQQQEATSEQTQQFETEQEVRHRHEQQKFTPSFSSWMNFSFTKNFIANVFC